MDQPRKEIITWQEVNKLVSLLPPQFDTEYDSIIMVIPNGIIPGGILAAFTGIDDLHVAKAGFPPKADLEKAKLCASRLHRRQTKGQLAVYPC